MQFDPSQPTDAFYLPEHGEHARTMSRQEYVPFQYQYKGYEPQIPLPWPHLGGWRASVDMNHTDWPYRVIALTVYSDPAHPRYDHVVIHPEYGMGISNFADKDAQSKIYLVDVAAGLPPEVVSPEMGDLFGLIGPDKATYA